MDKPNIALGHLVIENPEPNFRFGSSPCKDASYR